MIERQQIPTHLSQPSWLDFEQNAAIELCNVLSEELEAVDKKPSAKRVHDTRVALRRWDSVWAVLEQDGWSTKKFDKTVVAHLRDLRKILGKLRDWDVNIELGEICGVPDEVLIDWVKRREKTEKRVKKEIRDIEVSALVIKLHKFVHKRPLTLKAELSVSQPKVVNVSAYDHLEPFLVRLEQNARKLEKSAKDWESLHQLRLAIKAWRYFLTELFSMTNIELVRGQQMLGKYNDLQRILMLLREDEVHANLAKDAIAKIESQSEQLMKEFTEFRKRLPYGLRPVYISFEKG